MLEISPRNVMTLESENGKHPLISTIWRSHRIVMIAAGDSSRTSMDDYFDKWIIYLYQFKSDSKRLSMRRQRDPWIPINNGSLQLLAESWQCTWTVRNILVSTVQSLFWNMALTNILLLSQIAGYVVALILSICIIVPMSLHQDEFR